MRSRIATLLVIPLVACALLAAGTGTASADSNTAAALTGGASASADKVVSVLRLHRTAAAVEAGPDVIDCYLTVNTPRKVGTTLPRMVSVYAQVSCDLPIDYVSIVVAMHFAGVPLVPDTVMGRGVPDSNFTYADSLPTYCGVNYPFQGEAYAYVENDGYTDEGGLFGAPITFTNCI